MDSASVFLAFFLAAGGQGTSAQFRINKIEVRGNFRVPAESILRQISASSGARYDENSSQKDLKKLHATGLFQDLEVTRRDAGPGQVDLEYRVREYPFLASFEIEGAGLALSHQIRDLLRKEKLTPRPATPFRPETANKIIVAVRGFLRARRHPFPDVSIIEASQGNTVRAVLKVHPGPSLEVGMLSFAGNSTISDQDLLRQVRVVRPSSLLTRWSGTGRYSREDLWAEMERLRRYYLSRGYATVSVGSPETVVRTFSARRIWPIPGFFKEKAKLAVRIPILEGPQFQIGSVRTEGNAGTEQNEIEDFVGSLRVPQRYDLSLLENARERITRILGRAGYAMSRVELSQDIDIGNRLVRAVFKIDAGSPVLVGRIIFEGNIHLPDKYLRRELRLQEGALYDASKLDECIQRLNRVGLTEEIRRNDVALKVDEEHRLLDVSIKLREKQRRSIFATGGTGGAAGGYLGIICSAFNLLGLGEKLSLELDGGASQSNVLLDLVASHFLGSPFTLALAGVNRLTNFRVASLIPNEKDLIGVFKSRCTGAGLAGSYPLTTKAQIGLRFQTARESTIHEIEEVSPGRVHNKSIRSDLSPSFFFDSTGGSGRQARGYRLGIGHTWSGTALLRSVDSVREAAFLRAYRADPFSSGRNLFSFQLQGVTTLPLGTRSLALERRFFPGDEFVRGFRPGALSAWSYDAVNTTASPQPAGADTAFGFSSEYRVPILGPLSGAAFVDMGWTRLSSKAAGESGGAIVILKQTNKILRMSTGGEMRVQLPGLRQPARIIFSWNPMRLDGLINAVKSQKLADPRGTIRFALGSVF